MTPNTDPNHRPNRWAQLKKQLTRPLTDRDTQTAVNLNPQTDLTAEQIRALLSLIDTTEKRRKVLGDLCTLTEHIAPLFIYSDSPYLGDHSHPLYKIGITVNELIGVLLKRDECLRKKNYRGGKVVEVVNIPSR